MRSPLSTVVRAGLLLSVALLPIRCARDASAASKPPDVTTVGAAVTPAPPSATNALPKPALVPPGREPAAPLPAPPKPRDFGTIVPADPFVARLAPAVKAAASPLAGRDEPPFVAGTKRGETQTLLPPEPSLTPLTVEALLQAKAAWRAAHPAPPSDAVTPPKRATIVTIQPAAPDAPGAPLPSLLEQQRRAAPASRQTPAAKGASHGTSKPRDPSAPPPDEVKKPGGAPAPEVRP